MKNENKCRQCGCTELNACVTPMGPCGWHEPDLCTACFLAPARAATLQFAELREMNTARCRQFFHPIHDWTPTDWGCAMAGEAGEACNLIKKLRRGEPIEPKEIGKELADVVIYADLLAARLGLNLAECVQQKFNEVSKRRDAPYRL